jgi:hypothetical protein
MGTFALQTQSKFLTVYFLFLLSSLFPLIAPLLIICIKSTIILSQYHSPVLTCKAHSHSTCFASIKILKASFFTAYCIYDCYSFLQRTIIRRSIQILTLDRPSGQWVGARCERKAKCQGLENTFVIS